MSVGIAGASDDGAVGSGGKSVGNGKSDGRLIGIVNVVVVLLDEVLVVDFVEVLVVDFVEVLVVDFDDVVVERVVVVMELVVLVDVVRGRMLPNS